MAWWNQLSQRLGRKRPSAFEYKCFFDVREDANSHGRTVAESLRHYGFESDPLRILGRYTQFTLRHANYLEAPPDTRILECNPSFLAHLWAEMLVKHYAILADLADFCRMAVSSKERTRLFRQVYLFYDVLWGALLLSTRINETGRVSTDDYPVYLSRFREQATQALAQNNMPFASCEGLSVFDHDGENKEDWDFYVRGELARDCYKKDFANVLSHLNIERDGSPLELIAKLHFRTCQVLDLSHKMSFMEMDQWWRLQSKLAQKHIDKVMTTIIPIP